MIEPSSDLYQLMTKLKELFTGYFSLQKRVIKLSLIRVLAKTGGTIMEGLITFVLICILLTFAGITGALWLSKQTGSYVSGFASMTGIVFVFAILLHLFRKPLFINPLISKLARKLHATIESINELENEVTDKNQKYEDA